MQIDGLIPFKSSTDQAMAFLYFLRIPISFCSLSYIKSVAIITGFDLSIPKKAYLSCLGNSSRINPQNFFLFHVPSLHWCLIFYIVFI